MEIHDNLTEALANGEEAALLVLDQSKAYNIIEHNLLLEKLKLIGFKNKALKLITSFLADRKQYIQVKGKDSETLLVGKTLVIQGSTFSGLLFLIYILDSPYILHNNIDDPIEYRASNKPNMKTFIDDSLITINKVKDRDIKDSIEEAMAKIETYAAANKLCLNPDKSQVMLVSKNKNLKENFTITLGGKKNC